jgi:hypothetical protein
MKYYYKCPVHGEFTVVCKVAEMTPTHKCTTPKCKEKKCTKVFKPIFLSSKVT